MIVIDLGKTLPIQPEKAGKSEAFMNRNALNDTALSATAQVKENSASDTHYSIIAAERTMFSSDKTDTYV